MLLRWPESGLCPSRQSRLVRFKTDENLHPDASVSLSAHGHDAVTVWDQGLRGTLDEDLAQVCKHEGRVLVSLDLDFSDIRTYPLEE